jgi:2-dehydro-3-deoxygalactonokinase
MTGSDPQLVALDWGTSSLRAWLLGGDGTVLAEKSAPLGILKVPDGDFAAAFRTVCGDWLARPLPAIASGMIGSRQGWVEAPYAQCPAGFDALTRGFAWAAVGDGTRLAIVPGVSCAAASGVPDVMRGEETQVFGALGGGGESGAFVLPGTHSKWVRVAAGRIESFATYMTGEVFAVMREHSILGRMMPPGATPHAAAAFRRGWETGLAADGGLLHRLFGARTLGLFGTLAPEEAPSYLSGLLIGDEVRAAAAGLAAPSVTLVGDPVLCERYCDVIAARGIEARVAPPDAARTGLWRIAVESGLVSGGRGHGRTS